MAAGQARISIAPNRSDVIYRGHGFFTVTLQKDLGAGFVAAAGETVTVTFTPANGATAVEATGGSTPFTRVTDAGGLCRVGYTCTTCGTITGFASSTLTVLGVPVTVSTNGVAPNSGTALGTWGDGRISLSPLLASNAVTVNHTVTALVERNLGAGAGYQPVNGIAVTIRLWNEEGAVAAPAGPFTGNTAGAGTFGATFTSAVPGRVRARASSTAALPFGVAGTVMTGEEEVWGRVVELLYPNSRDASKTFV